MEPQTALVRPKSGVVLDAVPAVDVENSPVVLPDDAELDDTFGDGGDLERSSVLGVLVEEVRVLEGAGELCSRGFFSSVSVIYSLCLLSHSIPLSASFPHLFFSFSPYNGSPPPVYMSRH